MRPDAAGPFISLDGGRAEVGSNDAYPEERPARLVDVTAFELAVHPVTVGQYARFVEVTGYVTLAERTGASAAFRQPDGPVDRSRADQWWAMAPGASWLAPFGIDDRRRPAPDLPVTHIALADAEAFCDWASVRLPTEEEWEFAARQSQRPDTWPLDGDGRLLANVWVGEFPWRHDRPHLPGPQPVGSLGVDDAGFADLLGNVWEWTSNRWDDGRHVIKGGSFLCSPDYCARYRPSARLPQTLDEPTCHIGFRVARSATAGAGMVPR